MILLDCENLAILNVLRRKSIIPENGKIESVDARIPDDDGITYHIHSSDDKSKIHIDISVPFYNDYKQIDTTKYLSSIYKTSWSNPDANCHYRIIHDVNLPEQQKEESCSLIASFRKNLYCAFFDFFHSNMKNGTDRITLTIRKGEMITLESKVDRVNTTYTLAARDSNEMVVNKVFFQEFKEGRKAGKHPPMVQIALKDPPAEVSGIRGIPTGPEVGYITFVLTAGHLNQECFSKTVECIHNFLPYLKYHLSAGQAYLHMRMRSKTDDFIKIINRARPDATKAGSEKKALSRSAIKT